ncbi:hypothetical protein BH11ACT5_BH11ACT5_07400 [soil metagenome]
MTFLLSPAFPGAEELRAQAERALVATNCGCGCGSFAIFPEPAAPSAPTEATGSPTAWHDDLAADMYLMIKAGRLTGAEITYYATVSAGVPPVDGFEIRR